ncbi:Uma2 family endonuclease [Nocardia panacis]|uniref:Uma2 family endonuclease n=2 Tax=Nocardia panacis TaxID=2340916 RepID=A0A3A4KCN7_9NOCA|nr:Uma2 family endonuclease [Nocardia panacis]
MPTHAADYRRPRGGYWTAADLEHMPDDGSRYEVLNGLLVVNVAPKPRHQVLIKGLERALDAAVPSDCFAAVGVGVLVGDDEPIPDLIVCTLPFGLDDRGIPVDQVRLAVEVVSKSTTLQDHTLKPVFYAEAGIPNYWRIEINPFKGQLPNEALPVLFAYEPGVDGSYAPTHRVSAGQSVTLRNPFELTIDPGTLLPF